MTLVSIRLGVALFALTLLCACAGVAVDAVDARIRYVDGSDRQLRVTAATMRNFDGVPGFSARITNTTLSTQDVIWNVDFYDANGMQVSRSLSGEQRVGVRAGDDVQVIAQADNPAATTFVMKVRVQ